MFCIAIVCNFVANGLKELILSDFHNKFEIFFGKQDLKDFLCQDILNGCWESLCIVLTEALMTHIFEIDVSFLTIF